MNTIDMIIIAVVGVFLIRGIFRGLTRELASIVGVIAGFYAAFIFSPLAVSFFPEKIAAAPYAGLLGYGVVFCGVFLAVHLVGWLIRKLLGVILLGWLDRVLGAAFGAVKGALILVVVFFVVTRFVQPESGVWKQSLLYPYGVKAAETMAGIVSGHLPASLKAQIERLQNLGKSAADLRKAVGH
ncbi:MAG: CvpA family protein [Thermodesulfobacteriota bacterium]